MPKKIVSKKPKGCICAGLFIAHLENCPYFCGKSKVVCINCGGTVVAAKRAGRLADSSWYYPPPEEGEHDNLKDCIRSLKTIIEDIKQSGVVA